MSETIGDEFDEEILMLLLKKPSVLIDDFVAYPNMYGGSPGKAIVRLSNSEKYRTTTKIISDFKTIGVFETRNTYTSAQEVHSISGMCQNLLKKQRIIND